MVFMVISRNLDLVSHFWFFWFFCHQKKFLPLFFVPCQSRLLGEQGRIRFNAWCERSRGVCVTDEVSMCRVIEGSLGTCAVMGGMCILSVGFGFPLCPPCVLIIFV